MRGGGGAGLDQSELSENTSGSVSLPRPDPGPLQFWFSCSLGVVWSPTLA